MIYSIRVCLSVAVILSVIVKPNQCELFTSLGHLTKIVESEIEVSKYLRNFLNLEQERLKEAEKIVSDFEAMAEMSGGDPDRFIGNPVNAYLVIKQLMKDLQKFVDTVNTYEKLKDLVSEIKEKYVLPSSEDYSGAIQALHRLSDTYLLNPKEIRLGNLSKNYPSRPLNAFECFEMGRIAYDQEDFYHTVIWMIEALEQAELEGDKSTVDIATVLDYLAYATAKQGNLVHAIEVSKRYLSIYPNDERTKSNMNYYKRELKELKAKIAGDNPNALQENVRDPFAFKNERPEHVLGRERDEYEALCRGDAPPISNRRLSKLKCRYIHYHPMLKIAPVKEEQMFDNPAIWLYHDVITEKQIQRMKYLAEPKLRRAIVRSPITGKYETADYRISKSGWLTDGEDSTLPYLTKLVSAITNLSMSTAEEWQIANYGLGGQYEPHFDFARKTEAGGAFGSEIGNRIATWLFYLEAPEKGGATVFPKIGARVTAVRRAAAFWYNLHPSGDGDYRTRHAACPVLFGTKWVSNKWIHAIGQEFLRPCNLVPENSEEDSI